MIVLFPTYARRLAGENLWRATVAGMVTRPLPPTSRRRVLALAVLRRLLDLSDRQVQSEVFKRRANAFLFQRVAGEPVQVAIAGRLLDIGLTDRVGHFQSQIDLDESTLAAANRLSYQACLTGPDQLGDSLLAPPASSGNPAGGTIPLIGEEGLSVISDIDDTVKVTEVANRRELLANTLVREFSAVPGMVDVYDTWLRAGAAFHYVSASPWQLATCLDGFLHASGLPAGSMHLKLFRLKDSTPLRRLPSRKRSKRRIIEQIMADFPRRRFLLVGDSGERDPELYAAIAKRNPRQIVGIAIRQVAGHAPAFKTRARLERIRRRLPPEMMLIFTDPTELARWSDQAASHGL